MKITVSSVKNVLIMFLLFTGVYVASSISGFKTGDASGSLPQEESQGVFVDEKSVRSPFIADHSKAYSQSLPNDGVVNVLADEEKRQLLDVSNEHTSSSSTESNQLLKLIVANATPFSIDDIEKISDLATFSNKLSSIIDGNYYESEYLQDPSAYESMSFYGSDLSTMAFPNDYRRILTGFSSTGYSGNEVLVKWYNPVSGEVLSFEKHTIFPENTNQNIWLDNKNEWSEGQYNVEVYATDESLQLISASIYYVSGN